jgi:antitoxin component YwqK of YwqJK toxin-antitoxin module
MKIINYNNMIINNLIKPSLFILLLIITNSCSSQLEVNCSELIEDEGLIKLNSENFTGSCLTYFEDDQSLLKEKRSYRKGLMHGNWTQYYPNGNIYYDSYAKKGEIHGKYKSYHYDGAMADRGRMKNGYKNGVWEYFGPTGVLYRKEFYKNKKLIDEEYLHYYCFLFY